MDEGSKVEKVLGEPIFPDFSENVLRIRRNLLFVSFIVLIYKWYGLSFSGQLWGLTIENINASVTDDILFLVLLYHATHFGWATWDHIQQWRIRLTGTRLAHQTGAIWGTDLADYPSDPRQSSLYRWWVERAGQIGNISGYMTELDAKVKRWGDQMNSALTTESKINLNNAMHSLGEMTNAIHEMKGKVKEAAKVISSQRIPASLERFDNWFFRYQRSELARWFVLEWGLPILLGLSALSLTFPTNRVAAINVGIQAFFS